jgi:poly(3-hydroxybutyrate) depolymerase
VRGGQLYDTLESQLCIDTTREFASGESNGGMQTYQLGVDLHQRLAAISPEARRHAPPHARLVLRVACTHEEAASGGAHAADAFGVFHICAQFGSFHRGFAMAPKTGVPVLDLHGSADTTVPANVSLSADGYYYTTTKEIFEGGKYSSGWKKANG